MLAWWQAIKSRDITALAETLTQDYISTGGPAGRVIGRAAALTEAQAFLSNGKVDAWTVRDVVQRDHGDAIICSYAWEETGRHLDAKFTMSGYTTDVITRTESGWRISAHHTSLIPGTQ